MNDRPPDWIDKMYALAAKDPWRRACCAQVEARTESFRRLRARLTETERMELDLYIAACEEQEHSLIYLAYQAGQEDQ